MGCGRSGVIVREDVGGYTVMTDYKFIVTVQAKDLHLAQRVMQERIDHTEDYGFPYMIDWS